MLRASIDWQNNHIQRNDCSIILAVVVNVLKSLETRWKGKYENESQRAHHQTWKFLRNAKAGQRRQNIWTVTRRFPVPNNRYNTRPATEFCDGRKVRSTPKEAKCNSLMSRKAVAARWFHGRFISVRDVGGLLLDPGS